MIDYIKGEIAELTPTVCVIESCGIGYALNISLYSYQELQEKKEAKLYVYESIREDAFTLYGFMEKEERELFLLLISVSGVGAGTARVILSGYSVEEIVNAIASENVKLIKGVKGIGQKTAERIIVDLKDKVGKVGAEGSTEAAKATAAMNADAEEAIAALVALGFMQAASAKAVEKVLKEEKDLKVSIIIKRALKIL